MLARNFSFVYHRARRDGVHQPAMYPVAIIEHIDRLASATVYDMQRNLFTI